MLKINFCDGSKVKHKYLAHVKQLRILSQKHKLALKNSASKFYPQNLHNLQNLQKNSRYSSILFSKNSKLRIINSKNIENLNWQYNSYTEIENACNIISEKYADGTFYLHNNYPTINFSKQIYNNRTKLGISKNLSPSFANRLMERRLSATPINKKYSKENELVLKFFS